MQSLALFFSPPFSVSCNTQLAIFHTFAEKTPPRGVTDLHDLQQHAGDSLAAAIMPSCANFRSRKTPRKRSFVCGVNTVA